MIKRGSLFHTSDGYGGSPPESDQAIVRFAMKTPNLSPEKNALLEQRLGVAAQARAKGIVIPRRTNQDPAPLSFAQRQMWVIDQMSPGNPAYNLPIGYRLKGPLDLTALENSFNEVIKRHEALRTTFAVQDGEPLQFIHSDFKIKITITDLSHLTGEECENRLQALASEESVKSFDLSRLPLIRVSLFKLDETEHVLIINLHHTVADGLSTALLLNEVDMFYRAFTEGGEPHPRELTVQYADFALWQHRTMADEAAYARKTEFWRKQLGGSLPILQLPSDKSRPTFQSFKGSNVFFNIPAALTQDLRSLGAREERTFFTIVLAAFQVLLHRYSGAEDIIIGTPVAARTPAELEPLIGLILNMVPLRCDLSDDPAFIDLLRRTGDTVLDAFSNDLPLEVVMKHLKFERDPSRNPIFQVALQVLSTNTCRIGYLDVSSFDFDLKFAPFDLTLHLYEDSGGYHGRFQYCTDLFHPETIQRLSQNFVHLLHAIVREPDQRISALPILTDGERQQVLVDWNQTTVDYPRNRCIHELFETQAKCTPDAVALEYEGLRLTYGELNARANQIARYLARHGVGPETMVGICVERSLEMVAAILGILKAGGAYVPLDPDYPASRLSFMLEDTGAPVLLTQAKLRDKLPPYAGRTVALDADWPQIANEPQDDLNFGVNARNLAYVIYTSGSTGRPKGTCIEHRSVVRLVKSVDYIELGPQEVFLQFAPISFDASTLELWGSLLNGAKLVVCPAGLPSLEQLGRVIQERGVTTLWLTASLFHQMVDEQIESLRGVRQLLAGGETLSVPHVRRMLEVLGNNRLINGYGPTENTTFTCCHVMTSQSRIEQTVPIGRPISNTRVYVLDRYMQPVPIGAYGELYIGGDGLAREYLHQPELTTEKFVSDPFGSEAGARLYRTGDLVRFRTDGCIEFLGRIDHQVKIRGYRIELGEIETSIAQHSAVREVAVIAREDTPGDKRLVAYLVAPNPPSGFVDQLRTLLRASLPQYMMPAAFVLLDAFPITPNGKLDRNALPAPEVTAYATRGYEVPLGEIETRLAQIWSDVLKVERVGRHDHFFDLGGHSLLAVSVIERMRREGLHADVRALFATPTLAALAAAVGGDSSIVDVPPNRIPPGCDAITPEMLPLVQLTSDDIEHIVSAVPGGAANIQDIYPLAPLQEGILFHHLMSTEGDPYLLSASYAFDSQARLERYLQAVQAVVDRHDILRTAVLWEGLPEPVQVVCRQTRVVVEVVSLEPGAGDAAQQLSARFDPRHYRLDVRQAPMLRIFIAHDAANARWVMLQLFHHLSIDHTAQEVMQQEIQAHLLGQAAQLPTPLPFRNFVTQARLGVSREEHEAFFQKLLGDVDEPTAPFGLIDVQGDGSGIAEARRPIDAPLARRLRERARALGVSAASVCHLAWAQVLARVSGRDDVVFGTLLFGRMQGGEGADRVLGLFMNTLPVRIRVGDETVQASVRHTHTLLAQLLRHEHAPLALAQRCSAVAPPAPLFSALLNYRHDTGAAQPSTEVLQAWEGIECLGGEERTNYPFVLSVDDLGEGFALTAQVQSPIDPLRICAFMHTALEQLVSALESAPTTSVRSLDVLPVSERQQLLVGWNTTAVEYPKDRCLHQLIEAQAGRTPDQVAVVFEQQTLTYCELDARASRMAQALRSRGVGRGQRVGLCIERSADMLAAVLGILKAGAAYVPLDPSFPEARLRFMADDAQLALLVSTGDLAGPFGLSRERQLLLDADAQTIYSTSDTRVSVDACTAQPGDPAYVIYTSGSTGKPKGVVVPHRAVVNFLSSMAREPGLSANDVLVAVTTLSFDIAVLELYLPLTIGATVVIATHDETVDGLALGSLLERHSASVMQATPVTWRLLLEAGWTPMTAFKALVGGEAMPENLADQLIACGVELWNMYGPTETTVWSTCACITDTSKGITIGKPIANTTVRILDARKSLCPIGVPGELCIGGDGVALGYWNRPELTADRFIPDPFSMTLGATLYCTGDRARWCNDGTIEHLGRLDFQVKLRGFRIEVGEIEAGIAQHPAVREVAVIAREDTPGDKRLVAYLVVESPPTDLVDQLRALVRAAMPDYMVPAHFVILKALPRTYNGKLDRKALPAPSAGDGAPRGVAVSPRTPTEEMVLGVFRGVLDRGDFEVFDNFFDLGGHSLMAARIMFQLRAASGRDLPLRVLFERPTVSALAEAIDSIEWVASSRHPPAAAGNRVEIEL